MRDGVLQQVPYQDHPPRAEYRLTQKGRDFWHVVTAMRQWGDRWAAPAGPPLEVRHDSCGHVVEVLAVCSHCGARLGPQDLTAIAGRARPKEIRPRTRVAVATPRERSVD